MKRLSAFVAAGAFLASALATAPAGAVGVVSTTAVQALYDSQCKAVMHGDSDALRTSMASNFMATLPFGGMQTRDQVIDTIQSNMDIANFSWCTIKIDSVRLDGNDVVAVVEQTISGWTDPAAGDQKPVSIHTVEEDRWSASGPGYQEIASAQHELTLVMAGQVLRHVTG
jgi:hypothetical protein